MTRRRLPPRIPDAAPKGCLAMAFAFGLALICAPIYVVLHRNRQSDVVLERWQK